MKSLFVTQVTEPEVVVCFEEMFSLVAAIAVHAVRVDHEFELLALPVKFVDELERALEMYVVVTGSVSDFQHDRLYRRCLRIGGRVRRDVIDDTGGGVSVLIGLRRFHETFGVMAVIQNPVIHSPAGNPVVEIVRSGEQQHCRHRTAEREALDSDFVPIDIRQ